MRCMVSAAHKIPVTVIIAARNEAARIERCLAALGRFDEIIVLDSGSTDGTGEKARNLGARIENFTWDGKYPKKRQWALDNLRLKHDWIFFVDADEVVTPKLCDDIAGLFSVSPSCAGYFVRGLYVIDGRVLRHGIANNKLCLFDRRRIAFPVVGDLDLPGMGEVVGHYQPVLKGGGKIGNIHAPLLHYAYEGGGWEERHARYAAWERGMNARNAWPRDPVAWRQALKLMFRNMPLRAETAFVHSFILKAGFFDGYAGFQLARDRWRYYRQI